MTTMQLPQPEVDLLKMLFVFCVEENKITDGCPTSVADMMGLSYPQMEQMLFKLSDLNLVEICCHRLPGIFNGVETKLFYPIKPTSMRIAQRGIHYLIDTAVVEPQEARQFIAEET